MKFFKTIFIYSILLPAFFLSCMGPKRLATNQTFLNIKPAEQLPVYDLGNIPVNLEVIIENVADKSSSYKNRAAFYINDHLIVPDEEISNVQNIYNYRLKLQPGIYIIRGEYYALDGYSEKKYKITPQTKVMVKPGTLTRVTYKIEKKWDGTPLHEKMTFNISYTPLNDAEDKLKPVREKTAPPAQRIQKRIQKPRMEAKKPVESRNQELILLQVKTVPAGAAVSIDSELVGMSPIGILLDRNSDHLMLLSKTGYEQITKHLDKSYFGTESTIHVIHRLAQK